MSYLKNICGLLAVILSASICYGQDEPSPIPVNGKIVDKFSEEPIVSRIYYESLPYGSKIGVFRGDTFNFKLEGGAEYSIKVEAEGYSTYYGKVKPDDATNG
ncbi:MAG: hypothetical protein AAGG59_14960, partial [Bacteroidota bacterium]